MEDNYAGVLPSPHEVVAAALDIDAPVPVHDGAPSIPEIDTATNATPTAPTLAVEPGRPVRGHTVPPRPHERLALTPDIDDPEPYTDEDMYENDADPVPVRTTVLAPRVRRDTGAGPGGTVSTVARSITMEGLESVDARGTDLARASYDAAEASGIHERLAYQAGEETTAMDAIRDLAAEGRLDATIVEQSYFSPVDEDGAAEGWNSDYWFVQIDGMDVNAAEISVDRGAGPELAMNSIDEVDLSTGDVLQIDESDRYRCGAIDPDEAIIEAWDDRFRWYDDNQKRAVYAALADGSDFMGAEFDLAEHGMHDVRSDFIDDFGVAPERVVDNVSYSGTDAAPVYGSA